MKKLNIWNVRLGLAMNSSSTHSMLLLGPGDPLPATTEDRDFGWDYWTAASKEAKQNYFSLTLLDNLRSLYPVDVACAVAKELFDIGNVKEFFDSNGWLIAGVDHQSLYTFPRSWDERSLDHKFIEEYKQFLMQDRLIVVGGNDNDDVSHPLSDKYQRIDIPDTHMEGRNAGIVARKDPTHNYWSIFNRETGAKIRFSFDSLSEEPQKASAPELVDVKITDFCPFACSFCYQNSTTAGKHASTGEITAIIDLLSKNKVFEIAFGGGEPTLHPDFSKILSYARRAGIVPNFTTKNLGWLRDPKQAQKITESMGGFAFSVETSEDIDNLASLLNINGISHQKVTIQHVVGSTFSLTDLLEAADRHRLSITLLGYKLDGRGKDYKPKLSAKAAYAQVVDFTKTRYLRVGIDTALAKEWESLLQADKIPRNLYHTKEGKFSMYIDAVVGKAGPASYDFSPMQPYSASYYDNQTFSSVSRAGKDIMDIFQEF